MIMSISMILNMLLDPADAGLRLNKRLNIMWLD